MSEKKNISYELYSDSEKMLEQIVDKYDLPNQSKALRCLLDYVEENESDWDANISSQSDSFSST